MSVIVSLVTVQRGAKRTRRAREARSAQGKENASNEKAKIEGSGEMRWFGEEDDSLRLRFITLQKELAM